MRLPGFRWFLLPLLLFLSFLAISYSESDSQPETSSPSSTPSPTTSTTPSALTSKPSTSSPDDYDDDDSSDGSDSKKEESAAETSSVEDESKPQKGPSALIEKGIRAAVENLKPMLAKEKSGGNLDTEDEDENESDENEDEKKRGNNNEEEVTYPYETRDANETINILRKMSKMVSSGVEGIFRESIPLVASLGYDSDLSSECLASLLKLFNGIRKQETWAFRRK